MFRRTLLGLLAAVGLGGAAHAAVVGASISDPAATVLYDPSTPSIIVTASDPVATPPVVPAPDFAILINTTGNVVDLTVEDGSFNTILSATGIGFTAGAEGVTALLQTVTDTTGLFGPQLQVSVNIANFDPAAFFTGTGELVIENAPDDGGTGVVPLPAAAPLLAGGLALMWGASRRRRAA